MRSGKTRQTGAFGATNTRRKRNSETIKRGRARTGGLCRRGRRVLWSVQSCVCWRSVVRCVGGLSCCVVSVVAVCSGFFRGRLCRRLKTWLFSVGCGLRCGIGGAVFRAVVLQAAVAAVAALSPKRAACVVAAVGRLLPLGRKTRARARVLRVLRRRWVQGLQVAGGLLQAASALQLCFRAPSAGCR